MHIILLICVIGISCNSTKHLNEDQYLLRRNNVQLNTDLNLSYRNILKDEIVNTIKQKPNSYFLGVPFRIHLYNLRYRTYKNDASNFQVRTNFVEAPVIYDSMQMVQSANNIKGFLTNQGFFQATVEPSVKYQGKKASVSYKIITGNSLAINNVKVHCEDSTILNIVQSSMAQSTLVTNKDYNHFLVSEERIRIVNVLRNWGYYDLGTNNITFELDSTNVTVQKKTGEKLIQNTKPQRGVNIDIFINKSKNKNTFKIHQINDVSVVLAYQEGRPVEEYKSEIYDHITFRYIEPYINLNIINQKILLRPNEIYTQQAYAQTLQLLNELELFQFVRILVEPAYENSTLLDVKIILSPNKKYDFSTNVEVTGGDLYTIGSAVNLSLVNKNVFKGANKFTITGSYGVEINKSDDEGLNNRFEKYYIFSQNAGLNFNLTFPKFLLPIQPKKISRSMVPKTFLEGGINYLRRTEYFDLRSVNTGWGYRWRASTYEQWSLKPAFVNFLHLSNISPIFQQRMDSIPAIKNSYQETFIEGEHIEYVYNTELKNPKNYRIIKLGFEESGLLMNGINYLYQNASATEKKLRYSEYVRLDFDVRQYIKKSKAEWAFRFYGGVGIPYNKATSLPYIKQYFVGGAYSIRGWRPRVLGPGSYNALKDNDLSTLFVDQAGDMKVELNAEYRFALISLFGGAIAVNGATFIDAGNIWLMKPAPNLPGAQFKLSKFYHDLACSYGLGLRFDLGGFIVVRTDFAFQAKKPYISEHAGWTIQNSAFGNSNWRKENMNFNIAIGYPF